MSEVQKISQARAELYKEIDIHQISIKAAKGEN